MEVKEYLSLVANIVPSGVEGDEDNNIYISKFDNSYITRAGMEGGVKFMADNDITEELTNGVGFSPNQNKWYGWSHRAIKGFTIGSTCKKGDCHYRSDDINGAMEAAVEFWSDDNRADITAKVAMPGIIHVSWRYNDKVPNEKLRSAITGVDVSYELGRGEWVAKTMEDAKQMAIDFCDGVS